MTLTVRVPASTSNLGAGFDCLGLALDLWLEATLLDGVRRPEYLGTVAELDANTDLVHRLLEERGALDGHRLVLSSVIPIGRGLGSSAAAIVAGLALARLHDGHAIDHEAIYRDAAAEEGHPDNVGAAVYGGLMLAAGHPTRLHLHSDIAVALAVPETTLSTKAARDLLPDDLPRETAVRQAGRAAALIAGLATGEPSLIAFGMEDLVAVPHRKHLIAGYDAAVRAGREAGAFGVTISGSGSALLALGPAPAAPEIASVMAAALTAQHNVATALTPTVPGRGIEIVSSGPEGTVNT